MPTSQNPNAWHRHWRLVWSSELSAQFWGCKSSPYWCSVLCFRLMRKNEKPMKKNESWKKRRSERWSDWKKIELKYRRSLNRSKRGRGRKKRRCLISFVLTVRSRQVMWEQEKCPGLFQHWYWLAHKLSNHRVKMNHSNQITQSYFKKLNFSVDFDQIC